MAKKEGETWVSTTATKIMVQLTETKPLVLLWIKYKDCVLKTGDWKSKILKWWRMIDMNLSATV